MCREPSRSWQVKRTMGVRMRYRAHRIALRGRFGRRSRVIPEDRIARAEIRFTESKKTVFSLACGHNILLSLRYPGKQELKKRASVTIRNATKSIAVKGSIEKSENFKEIMFSALWTGGKTPDPADLDALMALFSSGQGLTVSAEGKSYALPAIDREMLKGTSKNCRHMQRATATS